MIGSLVSPTVLALNLEQSVQKLRRLWREKLKMRKFSRVGAGLEILTIAGSTDSRKFHENHSKVSSIITRKFAICGRYRSEKRLVVKQVQWFKEIAMTSF
jgi:hypothetical protein